MKNEGPSPEQLEHYRRFCFFDARNVLFETGEKRIEFHARAQQWIDYLDETDFCWIKTEQSWLAGLDPQTSNLNLKYVTSAKTSRPLSFTVVARPW
jgi:hypothetical protein